MYKSSGRLLAEVCSLIYQFFKYRNTNVIELVHRNKGSILAQENTILECIVIRAAWKFLTNDSFNPLLSFLIQTSTTFAGDLNSLNEHQTILCITKRDKQFSAMDIKVIHRYLKAFCSSWFAIKRNIVEIAIIRVRIFVTTYDMT